MCELNAPLSRQIESEHTVLSLETFGRLVDTQHLGVRHRLRTPACYGSPLAATFPTDEGSDFPGFDMANKVAQARATLPTLKCVKRGTSNGRSV